MKEISRGVTKKSSAGRKFQAWNRSVDVPAAAFETERGRLVREALTHRRPKRGRGVRAPMMCIRLAFRMVDWLKPKPVRPPFGAAPGPFLRFFHQTRLHRIIFNVVDRLVKV